jgi:hypothetical protein
MTWEVQKRSQRSAESFRTQLTSSRNKMMNTRSPQTYLSRSLRRKGGLEGAPHPVEYLNRQIPQTKIMYPSEQVDSFPSPKGRCSHTYLRIKTHFNLDQRKYHHYLIPRAARQFVTYLCARTGTIPAQPPVA